MEKPASPLCLLVHDGELADVSALMARLGLRFLERVGGGKQGDEARGWDLVVATPRRLLEIDLGANGAMPARIAVLDKDSKTLLSMLSRAGIDLVVRRPVHPSALRLLLLHSLYRGPEKRRSLRVSIGAQVQFRAGLRRRGAVLADLSMSGCRLLSPHAMDRGASLSVTLSPELTGGRGLSLKGQVVRSDPSEKEGVNAIAVVFQGRSDKLRKKLRAVVSAHARGPARLDPGDLDDSLAGVVGASDSELAEAGDPGEERDRRTSPRHQYAEHVIALGVEAARVLLGRDISLGGMRVDSNPEVAVGDELRIGLHLRAREEPLVVRARVFRDDGEKGLVLQFHELSDEARDYLQRMVNFLPILAVREDGEGGQGVIVSEILDHRSAAAGAA